MKQSPPHTNLCTLLTSSALFTASATSASENCCNTEGAAAAAADDDADDAEEKDTGVLFPGLSPPAPYWSSFAVCTPLLLLLARDLREGEGAAPLLLLLIFRKDPA